MQKSKEPELVETAGYIRDADGNLVPDYDNTLFDFDDGDIVNGVVVRIDRDEVLVDIGYKSEGVIPLKELSVKHDTDPNEVVDLGESIEAVVLQKEDADGRLILSKKRAEYEKSWIRIEEMSKAGECITGQVIEVVKGGLILNIGLRGFLPASLVDIRRVRDLNEFIGQNIECKIIELNRHRNNVVLSRRAVLEEEKKEQREHVLDNLKKGSNVKGIISSIVPFGAFVDLDGIDGLIHISELSWDHIDHPSDVLKVGDEVEVQVLEVNRERQRVSLGYKQLTEDPWNKVVEKWPIDAVTEGKVSKLVAFGVFVALEEGTEGLVHISEIAHEHVDNPSEVLSVGQSVNVKVIEIDNDKRRLGLSIKQTIEAEDVAVEEAIEEEAAEKAAETVVETAGEKKEELPAEESVEEVVKLDPPKPVKKTGKKPVSAAKEEKVENDAEEEADIQPEPETAVVVGEKTLTAGGTLETTEEVDVADDATLESVLDAIKKDRGEKKK